MSRDDLTLPLIEMRRAAARERELGARADAGGTGVRRWVRTSWHTLPGRRLGGRSPR